MDWIDSFFLLILASGILLGLGMGMLRGLFPLVSIFIAILSAGYSYGGWARDLSSSFKVVIFFLIFTIVFIVVNALGLKIYVLLTTKLHLGWIDRIGGGVLGLLGGLTFVGLIVILMTKFPFGVSAELFAYSKIVPYSISMIKLLLKILPEEFSTNIFELNII